LLSGKLKLGSLRGKASWAVIDLLKEGIHASGVAIGGIDEVKFILLCYEILLRIESIHTFTRV